MKTLLFTLEYPPFYGGVANYYGNLVKYWPACAPRSGASARDLPNSIFVLNNNQAQLINKTWPFLKWLPSYFALRHEVKQKQINHVLVGQILPLGAAALIYSKFGQIKYSVILHGLDFTSALKTWRKKIIAKMVLNGSKKIICANNYTADLVKSNFPAMARKIVVVNPGIMNFELRISNYELMKNQYHLRDKIILLSVGRLVKRKGFDKVIDTMPGILKPAPNLVYVVIGDGPEQTNLKFQISNLKLSNNVLMINRATDDERDAWYNLCDIFIMPTRNIDGDFEGFGMVYLEANLAGKPVIAGRSGGAADAVIDGLNGFMVDPENINDIGEKILKLALDHGLRRILGEQGKARAIRDFNWQKQAEKICNIIKPL